MAPARFKDLVLDAVDHQALADWWCAALGYERRHREDENGEWPPEWPVPIHDPLGEGPSIWFSPVPEAKEGKNRMHVDVRGDTEELLAMGATLLRRSEGATASWDVLADPEGNEFCVFPPKVPPVVRPTVR
ncbi:VOC family protein [Streptomyces triticirhizae]|uniref:VOC family protein n=1 Tax=Streptomyces triticirhizae TaxID=2483353 RepID=A0A3M2LZE2_9ACTN|nr:VOC family protein [Streptomyces triticirhizae]RMI42512.1 VOC family protein [Streptomyces triticirhizae]